MELVVLTPFFSTFLSKFHSSSSSSSSSSFLYQFFLTLSLQKMERSKAEGKRMMEGVTMEEEEEEDEDFSGLGFGEDSKKLKGSTLSGKKGSGGGGSTQPSCQVENCPADMTDAKKYHRRHKVCEFHAKATVVLVDGVRQRFCQQCSRFHDLSEFDEAKRSCRRRLAGHNERRRKSSYETQGEGPS